MHSALTRRDVLASLFLHRLLAQDTTFSTDVNVVTVLASVRNKQGEIVKDLTKDDFELEEDGRPQKIQYFTRETNLPLTLGLLIDTSGSQRRLIGAERSASFRFFQQVMRESKDMAFVIHFDREIELLQDLTSSRKKLQDSLAMMDRQPDFQQRGAGTGGSPGGGRARGGTALFDAVLLGSDELMRKQGGRKAHIVLSDGVDNGSRVSIGTAIEAAQRADTLVYSILFEDPEGYGGQRRQPMGGRGRRGGRMPMPPQRTQQRPDGKKILKQLSRETGGGFFEVTKKVPLEKVFDHIEEELRNQYSIGYTSDQKGAGFRKISLAAKQKGLMVQARQSYYANK